MTFKTNSSFNQEQNKTLMDSVEFLLDGDNIGTLTFLHDEKKIDITLNEELNIEILEQLFVFRDTFNTITQMLFMDIGYAFFTLLEKQNPDRAKEVAHMFIDKEQELKEELELED